MFPPPPPPPAIEVIAPTQPKSSSRGTPAVVLIQAEPSPEEAEAEVAWARGIQNLALVLTRTTSLLKEPRLSILIAKNTLRRGDHHHLNVVEIDDLYNNIIPFAMESALCSYIAKECDKALQRESDAQEIGKNLLQEEFSRLKAQAEEVKNTMKETLKSVAKLQVDLNEANTSKLTYEN